LSRDKKHLPVDRGRLRGRAAVTVIAISYPNRKKKSSHLLHFFYFFYKIIWGFFDLSKTPVNKKAL
jgi:hypothetical protein